MPLASAWLSVFGMFALRLKSFNAIEEQLRAPKRWEAFVGNRKPSADTIGYVFERISLEPIRKMLHKVHHRSWRSKSIHSHSRHRFRVIAVDGHELFCSESRCCDQCLVREIEKNGKKVIVYYHRVVVAQWVGVTPPGILDWELVRPGEGEVVAARRLLDRVLCEYARLVDVITADAIYLEAPFFKAVLDAGKHLVVVMKQEARGLYQDASQLRDLVAPEEFQDGRRTGRIWDLPDLTSFSTLGRPVRVVWAEEREVKRKVIGGRTREVIDQSEWVWVTDLPSSIAPATLIRRWGHDRWDIENRAFNELSHSWGLNHCFYHHPVAIEALLLTLSLAFVTTYLFFERNLKPAARAHLSRISLALLLADDLVLLQGADLWAP